MPEFKKELNNKIEIFEKELKNLLSGISDITEPLYSAMKYSLTAGGKRIRPVLIMSTAEMFSLDFSLIMPLCLSMELIHTYSLIHDDLPAMDNDDLRRGKPTNHKVYGEAMAILAGDALLNLAYEIMLKKALAVNNENYLKACLIIAEAAGSKGMIAGQALDIVSENKEDYTIEELQLLQLNKTAKLIYASVLSAAAAAGANDLQLERLSDFSVNLGLAFQTVDDILDAEGNIETVGKGTQKDSDAGKLTCIKLIGLEKSKALAEKYTADAISSLKIFGEKADFLKELSNMILKRDR